MSKTIRAARFVWLGLLALALIGIWVASAGANFAHGLQMAGGSPYWLVFGIASASADVLKAWALVAATKAWSQRRNWWRVPIGALVACTIVWSLTTAWGIRSCWGFISWTISDTTSGRTLHGVADKSLTKQIDDQVAQVVRLQDLKMKSHPSQWERIEAEVGRVEGRLDKLRAQARTTQAVGSANPMADMMLTWLGTSEKSVDFATTLLFMLMIEVCASLGFVAFMPLFRLDLREEPRRQPEDLTASPKPTPTPQRGGGKKAPAKTLEPPSDLRHQAATLVEHLERIYGEAASVEVNRVFAIYTDMAATNGWKNMGRPKLGQQLLQVLGLERTPKDERGLEHYALPTAREKRVSGFNPQPRTGAD